MDRKQKILDIISHSQKPVSASSLAKNLNVSRQIIVGDIALLRASGQHITATPRGYIMETHQDNHYIIAVKHDSSQVKDELYTIVDLGGSIIDVIVEHPIYGQLTGTLHLSSRYDVDQFIEDINKQQAKPLSQLTNGVHLHTIQCDNEDIYHRILNELKKKNYLLDE